MKRTHIRLGIGLTAVILAIGGSLHLYNQRLASIRPNYDDPNVPPRTAVNSAGQSEPWEVVRVTDGDTIVVRSGGREERIRFCGIDAPEADQPLGNQATALLQQLIDQADGVVLVSQTDRDRYGRMVGEVFTVNAEREKFLQEELLLAGLAYVYPQYVGSCPNAAPMEMAEAIAQQQRAGVWAGEYERPWEFRQSQSS
jgi:micrococcal nuclease